MISSDYASGQPSDGQDTELRHQRRLRVLVVEDEWLIGMATEMALQERGHYVVLAGDGEEGLKVLNSQAAFDVVVTDRQMPRMTGDVLVEKLRPRWPFLPVVVVTAHADPEAQMRLRLLGGPISTLIKPVGSETVVNEVERVALGHAS